MQIRSLKTAREVVHNFDRLFKFDTPGQKHYVYFKEKGSENIITVMKYPFGMLTLNRRGEDWAEEGEILITEDECTRIFWKNRTEINLIITLRTGKGR